MLFCKSDIQHLFRNVSNQFFFFFLKLTFNIYLKCWFATFEMLRCYIFLVSRNVNDQHFFPANWVARCENTVLARQDFFFRMRTKGLSTPRTITITITISKNSGKRYRWDHFQNYLINNRHFSSAANTAGACSTFSAPLFIHHYVVVVKVIVTVIVTVIIFGVDGP